MTPLDTAALKSNLLQQRQSLLSQLSSLRGGPIGRVEASANHFGQHEDSSAQTATERELEFALDDHESRELAAVNSALQRLDDGTYGQCTACGVPIAPARLEVAPEAERCIDCQEKLEHL